MKIVINNPFQAGQNVDRAKEEITIFVNNFCKNIEKNLEREEATVFEELFVFTKNICKKFQF